MSAEIELKFPVDEPASLASRLETLGFHLDTPRTFEQNTLYDTPDRSLRERGQLLRLRKYGSRHILTHKRHPDEEDPSSQYKVRIETETEVADGAVLAEVLIQLGYAPTFRYEKYRTEWSDPALPGAHLVLDETPIGFYAEAEGPPEWIDRTLAQLGVDPGRCLTSSYGRLFMEWKQRTNSPADNLTFDEILQPA
ncbi:class IV adenylate cyclase [Granulicella sp. WH15]|uniref:class IV adenylate cyclase n=1 Tax=Granulicella sp. WH15 TaxID=2602070 RepID=UPI001366AF17|nr:class IV adenylate cyclase [Granulicella sp. WH15]QHN03826.1 class IV adenylate cyclase [Granulicella sp. WH15]